MEDLFRSYWWLLFPLGWFIASGWQSWLNYRSRKDALRLVETYAAKGQEPPAELIRAIERPIDPEASDNKPSRTNWGWYQVALFGALAGGFVFMARANILGDEGLADALMVAAIVLGALALASLVYALTWKGPRA
jgi:hypothetical protein